MSTDRIYRSAAIVGAATGLSRLLGFVREVLMASFFGTSLAQSAFVVAFTIPNLFRRLFGEGALSAAFIPVFTGTLEREGRDAAWALGRRMLSLLSVVLGAIVCVGLVVCTLVLLREDTGARTALIVSLLRIMLPYMLFICLVALCMAILNAFRHFAVPAVAPVLLNVVWIFTLVGICPFLPEDDVLRIHVVAWGIVAAGALQLLAQFPVMRRFGYRLRFETDWRDPRVRRVLVLMAPAALGMGIHQVNVLVDRLLAVWVADWAPAALNFSERLIYLPLGVIATALGTVLLPTFSAQAAAARRDDMLRTLAQALRAVLLIMTPATVGLLVLAGPVVWLSFAWPGGAFDADSAWQTLRALQFYAPGLLVFSLYKLLTPVFYAQQDTRTPVRIGVWAVVLNLALNILFILTWPTDIRHAGLAAATVLSSGASCLALAVLIQRRVGSPGWRALGGSLLRCLLASAIMAWCAHTVTHALLPDALPMTWTTKARQGVAVLAGVATGIGVYALLVPLLCRPEWRAVRARYAGKRGSTKTGG